MADIVMFGELMVAEVVIPPPKITPKQFCTCSNCLLFYSLIWGVSGTTKIVKVFILVSPENSAAEASQKQGSVVCAKWRWGWLDLGGGEARKDDFQVSVLRSWADNLTVFWKIELTKVSGFGEEYDFCFEPTA